MSKVFAYFLMGLGLAMLVTGVAGGQLAAPPAVVMAGLIALLAGAALVLGGRAYQSVRQTSEVTFLIRNAGLTEADGRRLLGDDPPTVIEIAQELRTRCDPESVPLLMFAVRRLAGDRPPGWREMAGAMVSALERIGDPRPVELLQRLRRVEGADEIAGLEGSIAVLEPRAGLLRPANAGDMPSTLLRPAANHGKTPQQDRSNLLRPALGQEPRIIESTPAER